MNEMVERVARAIRAGRRCGVENELVVPCSFCSWAPDGLTPSFEETGCVWLARAAIAAMREPTEAMTLVGERDLVAYLNENQLALNAEVGGGHGDADEAWKAMIDEALAD